MRRIFVVTLMALTIGCGGGGGDDSGTDAAVDVCGFGSVRYLPFEVGFNWAYRVTDLTDGTVKTKTQNVSGMVTHTDGMPALRQVTMKQTGSTENLIRLVGDSLVRLEQKDLTGTNVLVRRNEYDPFKTRMDETPTRLTAGATWTENYDDIEYDANDVLVLSTPITENWEVLEVDVACSSPAGTFSCLHLKRTRVGGVAKEFWFARGVGKIREEGTQIEQLLSCSAN